MPDYRINMKSVLVVVHPGYEATSFFTIKKQGNYESYLSLLRDAVWSHSSVLFLYKDSKPPFDFPNNTIVIRDRDRGYYTKELVSKLRELRVDKVELCGESLWFIGADVDKNLKRYAEKLQPEKKIKFDRALERIQVLDGSFAKKLGLDSEEFINAIYFTGKNINPGCVRKIQDELKGEFPVVEIKRELCYPTVDSNKNRIKK